MLIDIFGVLALAAMLSGFTAVSWAAYSLRRRQCPGTVGGGSLALLVLAGTYLFFVGADVPGVLAALSNGVEDLPVSSSLRTLTFAAWLWVLWGIIDRLARQDMPGEVER